MPTTEYKRATLEECKKVFVNAAEALSSINYVTADDITMAEAHRIYSSYLSCARKIGNEIKSLDHSIETLNLSK